MVAVLAFALGASLGSFLNVLIDRLPARRSLARPRSACDACHAELQARDLVPVLSYLGLRGRCRHCGAAIPLRTLVVEVATAGVFLSLALQYGPHVEMVVLAAAAAFLLAVAFIDHERMLILNSMTLPAAVAAVALAPLWPDLDLPRTFLGHSGHLASLLNSLAAGAGAFGAFYVIYVISRGGIGEGDVKLAFVLGAFFGFPAVVVTLWLAVVGGGAVAALLWIAGRKGRRDPIPFGVFLAGGAIATLFLMSWLTTRYQELGFQAFTL